MVAVVAAVDNDWQGKWPATRALMVANRHAMMKADGGQQCNNQPTKGAAKAGGGGNGNSGGSNNDGDSGDGNDNGGNSDDDEDDKDNDDDNAEDDVDLVGSGSGSGGIGGNEDNKGGHRTAVPIVVIRMRTMILAAAATMALTMRWAIPLLSNCAPSLLSSSCFVSLLPLSSSSFVSPSPLRPAAVVAAFALPRQSSTVRQQRQGMMRLSSGKEEDAGSNPDNDVDSDGGDDDSIGIATATATAAMTTTTATAVYVLCLQRRGKRHAGPLQWDVQSARNLFAKSAAKRGMTNMHNFT